jgi:hypothetical protein
MFDEKSCFKQFHASAQCPLSFTMCLYVQNLTLENRSPIPTKSIKGGHTMHIIAMQYAHYCKGDLIVLSPGVHRLTIR